MFSYFKNGIEDVTQGKIIDISTLIKTVKNNPQVSKIGTIRKMKEDGNNEYKEVKMALPYITPGGIFPIRNGANFQQCSGYIYFDIDTIKDVEKTKQELICRYGNIISMICISCSGKGLSILVKPEGIEISKENYTPIWKHIAEDFFSEINFDEKTKDVTRPWFISYDQDVFYNPDAFIEIRKSISPTIYNSSTRLLGLTPSSMKEYDVKFLPIQEVFSVLKFKTEVQVQNKIFDIKPVEYCDVYFPSGYKIPNGKKQSVFINIIHKLVYLNSGVAPIYILSYLNFLNNTKTVSKAKQRDFVSLFNMVYRGILDSGELNPGTRIKHIHFKENTVESTIKRRISSQMTGIIKQSDSIERIQLARQILRARGEKETQVAVKNLIKVVAASIGVAGLSISTIKRYWNQEIIEIDKIVQELNESIQITYISKDETANNGVSDIQILDQNKNAA